MTKRTKILSTLGVLVFAIALITAGSFALFTSEASNEGNTLNAGTLELVNAHGSHAFYINNVAPGDSGTETVKVHNKGTLDAWVKVSKVETSGALFDGSHPVQLQHSEDVIKIEAGGYGDVPVNWVFPREAGNEYQGQTGKVNIHVQGVQVKNNDDPNNIDW
ncbi:TasA family protein [Numidum massiliense]|uniref:TasA family protein n=1 Tax=Numidum massiliense TaxID=1522315 RepID=UPI0006D5628E|nr:TasA family protein [Numidum massiliense]